MSVTQVLDVQLVCLRVAQDFLKQNGRCGQILFCGPTVEAINTIEDDINQWKLEDFLNNLEFFVVYAHQAKSWLGFHELQDTHDKSELTVESKEGEKPFVRVLEIKKFCFLTIKGNPSTLEYLFIDRTKSKVGPLYYWTHDFEELRACRMDLISRFSLTKYLGQARAYFPKNIKFVNNQRKKNQLDVVMRLLYEAQQILKREEPQVYLDGEHKDYVQKFIYNEIVPEQVLQEAKAMLEDLDKQRVIFTPFESDASRVNQWLVNLRIKQLFQEEIRPNKSENNNKN